jgi:hypothetical protein
VILVTTDISEECIISVIRVVRLSRLGVTEAVSGIILSTLIMEMIHSSETSVVTRTP